MQYKYYQKSRCVSEFIFSGYEAMLRIERNGSQYIKIELASMFS